MTASVGRNHFLWGCETWEVSHTSVNGLKSMHIPTVLIGFSVLKIIYDRDKSSGGN